MRYAMNFNQLRMFFEVAKAGNFTAAAKSLSVSQPAVSLQIRALESTLGIKLYDRVSGRPVLTQAGMRLQSYAERIFAIANEAEQQLAMMREAETNSLRIATTKLIAAYYLPATVGAFKILHQEMNIRLDMGTNSWAIENILAGNSDIGIVVNAVSDELERSVIFEDSLLLILPPKHPSLKFKNQKIIFENETLILREKGSRTRAIVEEALKEHGLRTGQTMELADAEAIKRAVRAGLGISVITAMAVQEEVKSGVLAAKSFLDGKATMRIEVVYRRERAVTPAMRYFLEAFFPAALTDSKPRRKRKRTAH